MNNSELSNAIEAVAAQTAALIDRIEVLEIRIDYLSKNSTHFVGHDWSGFVPAPGDDRPVDLVRDGRGGTFAHRFEE